MLPGKAYIDRNPVSNGLVFTRKKQPSILGSVLHDVFGSTRRPYSRGYSNTMHFGCRPSSNYDYDYEYRRRGYGHHGRAYSTAPCGYDHARVATTVRRTCSACGKFRSAGWQARHPLVPGDVPRSTICHKCRAKSTSSEDSIRDRRRRKGPRSRQRHYDSSFDDSFSSCEARREARRYHEHGRHRSRSRDYRRPHRSASGDNIRIVIANDASERRGRSLARTPLRTSSEDGVRIVSGVDYDELPGPRIARTRSSSHVIVDNVDEEYVPRRRSLSGVSILSSGTRYVEELDRPRYHSRPRSVRRTRFVDEVDEIRPRRSRSVSRVSFVDEPEEEIVVSKPRSQTRRRIWLDGAVSQESHDNHALASLEQNIPQQSLVRFRKAGKTSKNTEQPHQHFKNDDPYEVEFPRSERASSTSSCESHSANHSSDHRYAGRSASNYAGRHFEPTPPSSPSVTFEEVSDDDKHAAGVKSHARSEAMQSSRRSSTSARRSRMPNTEPLIRGQSRIPRERRRRYKAPSNISDSQSENALPAPPTSGYRHVSAPPSPTSTYRIPPHATPTPAYRHASAPQPAPTPSKPTANLSPTHPNHPDHIAYMISANLMRSVKTANGFEYHYVSNAGNSYYTPPATPQHAHAHYQSDEGMYTNYGHWDHETAYAVPGMVEEEVEWW